MAWHVGRKYLSAFAWILAVGVAAQGRDLRVGMEPTAEYSSLQAAVEAARNGDVIVLSEGRYSTDDYRNIAIRGKAITIRSRDPNDPAVVAGTILDCQGSTTRGRRAFEVGPGQGTRLTIMGLTIVNGYSNVSGGSILCEQAEFRAYNCTFSGNRVQWWGGALLFRESRASLEGCTFLSNASDASRGGAIFCETSVLTIDDCLFQSNTGGGVESHDSDLTLTRCIFQQNTSQIGGGIQSRTNTDPQKLSKLTLSRCTFAGNAAQTLGGALYLYEVPATIDACTFTANTAATDGGAIVSYRANPVITDCILAGNKAQGAGGAVMTLFGGRPKIIHCTLVANLASRGGALASKGQSHTVVSHCILWDNAAAQGATVHLALNEWTAIQTSSATVEYSNVQNGRNGTFREPGCTLNWSAGNLDAEPRFTGPTHDDYHLSPDSPCIDAGNPEYDLASNPTDLDGSSRKFGAAVDLGAHEYRGFGAVYHFRSLVGDRHFYTLSAAEREKLTTIPPALWVFEDIAYYAFHEPIQENLHPVYRFWSPVLETHFWTIHEEERLFLEQEYPDIWVFEGVAFYAFPQTLQPLDALPVYRFWSGRFGRHFYTIDEAVKNEMLRNESDQWEYEGPAWYAYPKPQQIAKGAFVFAGSSANIWFSLSLAATVDGREAQIAASDVTLTPASAQMQMTVDFRNFSLTLDRLSIQAQTFEHATRITVPGTDVSIPLVLSIEGSFLLPTQRGPFAIDPKTNLFADFSEASSNLVETDSTFTYRGSASLADQATPFDRTLGATRLELEAFGGLESLSTLPEILFARMPQTFQWHRQQTRDLLFERSVDGRRVQVFVVYSYAGIQELWEGRRID